MTFMPYMYVCIRSVIDYHVRTVLLTELNGVLFYGEKKLENFPEDCSYRDYRQYTRMENENRIQI